MSDDLLTTIKVTVDSSGVATGVAGAKRSLQDLGRDVRTIVGDVENSVKKMTDIGPIQPAVAKATKALIKDTSELGVELQKFGTAAFTGFSGISKSVEQAYVALSGKGISSTYIDAYIDKLKEAQGVQKFMGQEAAKASQIAAQAVEAENQRLAHTLELKRQIASVKTTVDKNNAAAQAAQQAEIEAQQKLKLLDINNKIQAAQRAAADAQSAQSAQKAAQQAEAKAQHQMRLLALNNQIQASNKATADAQAAQSAKAIKDLKDLTAAQAAYRQEVINSELNFTHTGRGKSTAFLADKGQRLGFDSSFIEKELAGYKKVEDAAKAAFQAANPHIGEMSKRAADAGTSVKGLSAALRQVPAQFTDIVVSLQGGQAPLTVLLQQGGQLKDVFGGVGNATRALSGYVVGLINPFTVAAATIGTLGIAYLKGAAEGEAYNKALITTGNAAGVTAGQLGDMAKAVAQATGGTVGAAAEALAGLAGTSGIAASQFEKIAAVATQMEKVTGVAVADTVKQFAELGKDPVGASLRLTESTKYLTAEVYEQIRALVEQGKTVEAGTVAQNALADVMKKRIPELVDNLGYLESGWKNVAGAAKGAWDFMAGIGRPGPTMAQKIAEQIAELEQLTAPGRGIFAGRSKEQDKELANLRMQAEYWAGIEKSKADAAALDAARIKQEEASIRLSETAYKNEKDRQVLMKRDIAKVDAEYAASAKSLRDLENYEKAIAQIKERYKEKASVTAKTKSGDEFASQRDAAKEWAGYMERFGNMAAKSTAEVEGLNKAQAELVKYLSSTAYTQMDEPERQLALQSAYAAIAIEQQADSTKALNKAQEALEKERTSAIQSHVKEIDSINDKAQKLENEVAAYGQSKEAIEALTTARMADRIEVLKGFDGSSEKIARIEETIAARKRLAAAGAAKDQKIANEKAAEDAAKEWQKTADKINDSITDALMRGFENGKGFAENLRDTVENIFKTMVLRPVVQATVNTGLGALGIPGVGGSSGAGGLLNTASNLNTLFGTGSQALFGASVGASSASLLGANAVGAVGGDALGALIAGNGGWAGVSVAAEAGAAAGAASGAAAATTAAGTGAAGALAAIPGWGWALGGALLLAGLTSGDNGPKLASTGDAIRRYDKGGTLTENATNGAWFFTNTQDANKLLDGLESRYQKAAKALGIGTVATQFDYGSNNRGNFALAGAAGNSRANTGEIAYSAEAMQVAASRAVFAALQGSELPKYLSGLLDSVGDINALSQTQIDDLLNTAQAFKGLHDVMVQMPFEALHDLSYDATKGLIEFSGGLDKLTQNLGTYYENFYSAEEKKAQTLANITKTLTDAGALTKTTRTAIAGEFDVQVGAQGDARLEQRYATSVENLDMPKTREEFRALVDSFKELSGPHAQEAYAALMSVSGAFASVTPAAADAAAALEKDLAARATWQQKLDVLTGKTTEQQIERANDLAGVTNEATAALIKQVHAQQDIAMSATKAADAMKAVAAANASIQGSKTQIYNVENDVAPERAALTAAQEAWAGAIKEIKDIAVNSFGQSQSDVAKWGAAEIEGFKVEDFADSEFFDSVQQALTDYWADKAALITANDSFAKAEAAAKDAAAKSLIDTHHDGLAKGNQIRDAELSLKARLYELTGDAGKLADVVKEQRDIIASGLSTTQADLQRQIWAEEDKTAGGAGKDILAERNNLQAELNALTDTAAQALARQRDALDESNRALFDNIQATKAAKAIADQRTELESRLAIATGASTALEISRKNELAAALDFSNRIMLESIYAAEDLASANEKAAASAKEAAAATLQNASTNASQALAGVQRAVDAQKKLAQVQVDVAQESVSNLSSIFNSLKANVAQLYGSVGSTTRQSAAQGNNFIAQALATAKSTGYFPDADDLADAVAAAMQGVDGNVYKSQADADFAKLSLAGSLSGLKDLSKTGLTTAEKALEAAKNQLTVLDQTLETARAQLDAVNGVNTSVLSVAAALDAFGAALGGLQAAKNASVAQYVGTATSAVPTGSRSHIDYKAGTTQLSGNDKPMATAELAKNVAQSWANAIGNPAVEDNVRRFMRDLELTPSALGIVLPGFASGINRVPYDMQAIIHKDEAVVPAAFNPFNPNAQQGSAGNARLEALVEGLTAEVQRLQAIVNDGNKQTRRTADAVNGNPEMPMLVETV